MAATRSYSADGSWVRAVVGPAAVAAIAMTLLASGVAADQTGQEARVTETYTWRLPDGQVVENNAVGDEDFPQVLVGAGSIAPTECGVWHQVDVYEGTREQIDGMLADGVLYRGEDPDILEDWWFLYGGDCVEPEPSPSPTPSPTPIVEVTPTYEPTIVPTPTPAGAETPVPTPTAAAPTPTPDRVPDHPGSEGGDGDGGVRPPQPDANVGDPGGAVDADDGSTASRAGSVDTVTTLPNTGAGPMIETMVQWYLVASAAFSAAVIAVGVRVASVRNAANGKDAS